MSWRQTALHGATPYHGAWSRTGSVPHAQSNDSIFSLTHPRI